MTSWEREADHYFPIGFDGLSLLRGIRGSSLRISSVLLAKSRTARGDRGCPCGGQNMPIAQQPDFRRVSMRYLSLVLAFTGYEETIVHVNSQETPSHATQILARRVVERGECKVSATHVPTLFSLGTGRLLSAVFSSTVVMSWHGKYLIHTLIH
jgi:hypothetical protein